MIKIVEYSLECKPKDFVIPEFVGEGYIRFYYASNLAFMVFTLTTESVINIANFTDMCKIVNDTIFDNKTLKVDIQGELK